MLRPGKLNIPYALSIGASFLLSGCGHSGNSGTTASTNNGNSPAHTGIAANAPTYVLISNAVAPFWETARLGMEAAGAKLKVNVTMSEPTPDTNDAQVTLLNDAVSKNAAGVGMSSINPMAITPTINKLMADKIPFISFDSDAPQSHRLAYLGTNNIEAGEIIGNYVKTLYPKGGKLLAFVANMSSQGAIDRYQGMLNAFKGTNITFIAPPMLDNGDKSEAQANVQSAITRYRSQGLDGLVGLYSYDGPAIIDAVHQMNVRSKFKIICFDGDPQTLHGLTTGDVDCAVVQKPYYFGYLTVMLLNYLHEDNGNIDEAFKQIAPEIAKHKSMKMFPSKHIIDTGVTLVTPANAIPFLKGLKNAGITST